MKNFAITSKISIDVEGELFTSLDKDADFDHIVFSVHKGLKFVNFRVTNLGDTVTAEFWDNLRLTHSICLRNDTLHSEAFQTLMENFLA